MDQIVKFIKTNAVAITIVLILCLVCYFIYAETNNKSDAKLRKKYKSLYDDSNGTFDKAAQSALSALTEIENPRADDYFNSGRILSLNMLEGRLSNAKHKPEVNHQILTNYNNAVLTVGATRTGRTDRPTVDEIFMLDHIRDFAEDNIQELARNNGQNEWDEELNMLFTIQDLIPPAYQQVTADKKQHAAETSNNRAEFSQKYLDSLTAHTSDAQNVHDSSVTKSLAQLHDTIKVPVATSKDTAQTIKEVQTYASAKRCQIGDQKYKDILRVLGVIEFGSYVSTYGDTEDNILKQVWDRSKLSENSDNADNIKDSVLTALSECVEHNNVVCTGGRAARLLGSLILLDKTVPEDVLEYNTSSEYKNEIYSLCKQIIAAAIEGAKKSSDAKLNAVGRSYEDPKIEVDDHAEAVFKDNIKLSIDDMIDNYKDKIKPDQLKEIKIQCYAAV